MMSRRESGCSQAGATMLARRCFLRRRASQRGMLERYGGRSVGVAPCVCSLDFLLLQNSTGTHTQKLYAVEALSRNDGDKLHLAKKRDLVGDKARRQWQRHGVGSAVACVATSIYRFRLSVGDRVCFGVYKRKTGRDAGGGVKKSVVGEARRLDDLAPSPLDAGQVSEQPGTRRVR